MVDSIQYYDPELAQWPDLMRGRVPLAPVRVGMDRTTGKMLVGWPHVQQSMTTIFATRYHERVLRRWCGSFVPHMLGESFVARIVTRFFWAIVEAIEMWEPDYRIKQIYMLNDRSDTLIAQAEEVRLGHATFRTDGVYRPRAHLGDPTAEGQRSIGFAGRGHDIWDAIHG